MLFLLLISGVIGYIIYEDTLSEWWIPVGVALMIAVATFPFYIYPTNLPKFHTPFHSPHNDK